MPQPAAAVLAKALKGRTSLMAADRAQCSAIIAEVEMEDCRCELQMIGHLFNRITCPVANAVVDVTSWTMPMTQQSECHVQQPHFDGELQLHQT